MIEVKTYDLRDEFCKILEIPVNQLNRRKKDLFEWFKNFYDFEIINTRPVKIKIKEVYGEYRPLPR